MTSVFWVCLALIAYVYVGYPVLLASGILGKRRPVHVASVAPAISVIIPAHNEEAVIGRTLSELSPMLSPGDRILVVADNCTDDTVEIARRSGAEVVVMGPVPSPDNYVADCLSAHLSDLQACAVRSTGGADGYGRDFGN